MGKITTGFSMSLDGYVAGPNEDVSHPRDAQRSEEGREDSLSCGVKRLCSG